MTLWVDRLRLCGTFNRKNSLSNIFPNTSEVKKSQPPSSLKKCHKMVKSHPNGLNLRPSKRRRACTISKDGTDCENINKRIDRVKAQSNIAQNIGLLFNIYKRTSMQEQQSNSVNRTTSQVNSSLLSGFNCSAQLGRLGSHVSRENSDKIQLPQQVQIASELPLEYKLQNRSFRLVQQMSWQKAYNQFIIKFQDKENKIQQAKAHVHSQRSQKFQECKIALFYLCYINYYDLRNHQKMLKGEFEQYQRRMIITECTFIDFKRLIRVNYRHLCYHQGNKETILRIMAQRLVIVRKQLWEMLKIIAPIILYVNQDHIQRGLKVVVRNMYLKSVEKAYEEIDFDQLLDCFCKYLAKSKIKLQFSFEEFKKLFTAEAA